MDDRQHLNSQRANLANEIITSGHVWKAVWYLAWPTAINTLILTAYNIVNRVFLGRLPHADETLAAVGIGGTLLMIQFALTIGLSAGTAALASRFLGAQNYDDAIDVTRQSLILSIISAIISGLPLIFFATPLVQLVGAKGDVIPLASDYTSIISWFSVPLFLYLTVQTALRSAGDAKSPLYAGIAIIAVNVVFDWLLIFGIGPFPAMGVKGAAISTGISRVVGMIVTLWFLRRSILGSSMERWRINPALFNRILYIGWPAAMQNLLWTTAYAGFVKILAYLPNSQSTSAQAALTVAITIEATAFMPGIAYSTAATPLVGQNLGASKPDRAVRTAWVATGQAVFIMTAVAIVFLFAPEFLARLFTSDATVVPLIVTYLRINALAEPFLAINMVLRGALQGAGDTRIPAIITFFTYWLIRLPLAWYLAITLSYGPTGAWIAMSFTMFLSGVLIAIWFIWGKWLNTQV